MNTSLAIATWAGYFRPLEGVTHNEDAAIKKELERLQIPVTFVDWATKNYSWRSTQHPAILVKSTWRYEDAANRFARWLKQLQHEARSKTINVPALLQWNMNKSYQGYLAEKGIATPNTVYFPSGTPVNLVTERIAPFLTQTDKVVVKPAISAASKQVTLLTTQQLKEGALQPVVQQLQNRPFLVQVFEPTIKTIGEKQAIVVGGNITHSVRIQPAEDNFVSQHSKGATRENYTLTQPETTFVQAVLRALPYAPSYARIDFFTRSTGQPILNEVEVIEPPLYLQDYEKSLQQFCSTMAQQYTQLASNVKTKIVKLFT